ncbi:MAG: radical SAM protein [Bacteroidota bacterium]
MSKQQDLPINDHWIRGFRGKKNRVDPFRPYHFLVEKERTLSGTIEDVITIFLTNRECRFTCLMCDLWKNTTHRPVPPGAIPAQIEWALEQLPAARHIKLYNSGNFFDPGAIPPADYPGIAALVKSFDTVIVENHPLLTGERCLEFSRMIRPQLQVAMGLETIHPEVLQKLNKKMKPEEFQRSVSFLKENGISSRAFILLRPPFLTEEEGIHWAKKSLMYAFESGTDSCTVIPTRAGNGAMEHLQQNGLFAPPQLQSLEELHAYGIGLHAGPVFADTWNLEQFSRCDLCFDQKRHRIEQMNLLQGILPPVTCSCESKG